MNVWNNKKTRGWLYQLAVLLLIVLALGVLTNTAMDNMQQRGIQSGYDFLSKPANFSISEGMIDFSPSDSNARAFLVGLLNTLKVSILGIILATILGTLIGISRFSKNALVRGLARTYLEAVRNIPMLIQLFMWYLVGLTLLPDPMQAVSFMGGYLSKAGFIIPFPSFDGGLHWDMPSVGRFGVQGGHAISIEFVSLLVGLTIYTASYISEIVRAGILSVAKGQREAAFSLGLTRWQSMRLVELPQALRVIIPPLTNQYLNLTKNSSLAVVVGYPELVSIANTTNNQTGRAIECMLLIMLVYLSISLITSLLMNLYNRYVAIQER